VVDEHRTAHCRFAARTSDEEQFMRKLYRLTARNEGQTMAEYSVVLVMITLAVLTALGMLSGSIVNALTRVAGFVA
jgi:Flp pilus assembly pilin Flp